MRNAWEWQQCNTSHTFSPLDFCKYYFSYTRRVAFDKMAFIKPQLWSFFFFFSLIPFFRLHLLKKKKKKSYTAGPRCDTLNHIFLRKSNFHTIIHRFQWFLLYMKVNCFKIVFVLSKYGNLVFGNGITWVITVVDGEWEDIVIRLLFLHTALNMYIKLHNI